MSRTGVEDKPPWRRVPEAVRAEVARALGAPVARGMRVWGGYGPTPTYRLRLADGRRAFFKGCGPAASATLAEHYGREIRVYRELGERIAPWAPSFYGSLHVDGWKVLLLEDLGPKTVPPWRPRLSRRILGAYATWHDGTIATEAPAWLRRPPAWLPEHGATWEWTADPSTRAERAAVARGRAGEADRWFTTCGAALGTSARALLDVPAVSHCLLHRDTRSDNLRYDGTSLRLLDWPALAVGPAEYDVAMFVQTITVEGGGDPETLLGWYTEQRPLDPTLLDAAVSAVAGFFAGQAWRPELPGLPRLRTFQRRQLAVTLRWAARRLDLPEPSWARAIAGSAPGR